MISETLLELPVAKELHGKFRNAITDGNNDHDELTLVIDPAAIIEVCSYLKTEGKFLRLSGITAVDWHPADPRFEVVYHLHSPERNLRLRLKCRVSGAEPSIASATVVWRGANWYEREVFDMFGITFNGHPDLTRILMPEDWEGYPLRKDYPVHGYKYSYQSE